MGKDEIFGQEGVYSRGLGSWGFPFFNFGESEGSVAFPFSILGHSRTVKMVRFLSLDLKRILFYSVYVVEEFWGKRTTFLRARCMPGRRIGTRSETPWREGPCLREWDAPWNERRFASSLTSSWDSSLVSRPHIGSVLMCGLGFYVSYLQPSSNVGRIEKMPKATKRNKAHLRACRERPMA